MIDFGVNDVIIAETEDANEEEKEEVSQDAVSVFLQVEGKARDKFKISPVCDKPKLVIFMSHIVSLVCNRIKTDRCLCPKEQSCTRQSCFENRWRENDAISDSRGVRY